MIATIESLAFGEVLLTVLSIAALVSLQLLNHD
jgi:hypothetical protein